MSNPHEYASTEKMCNAINSHFTFATGPVRLRMIRQTLIFEIRNPGMRMTAKAPKATTILRREFDIKGNKFRQLAIFESLLQQTGVLKPWEVTTTVGMDGKLRILTREEEAQLKKDYDAQNQAVN
ncbi:MAG: hypothetical protein ACYSSM_07315 [Planctomycetota bacterium]